MITTARGGAPIFGYWIDFVSIEESTPHRNYKMAAVPFRPNSSIIICEPTAQEKHNLTIDVCACQSKSTA